MLIARVESLMNVPFHLLAAKDQNERRELGAARSRETLSCVPFYAKKAGTHPTGEAEYWRNCWMSHVNMVHPAVETSTAIAASAPQGGIAEGSLRVKRSELNQRVSGDWAYVHQPLQFDESTKSKAEY